MNTRYASENQPAIILVDDEDHTRGAMRRLLAVCYPDVEIREACDGDEALTLLDDDVVCVISDISMPHRDGYHLCWSIRNAAPYRPWRKVPVVLVSAMYTDEDAMTHAWAAGTATLIPKPFGIGDIAAAVTGLTGMPAAVVRDAPRPNPPPPLPPMRAPQASIRVRRLGPAAPT